MMRKAHGSIVEKRSFCSMRSMLARASDVCRISNSSAKTTDSLQHPLVTKISSHTRIVQFETMRIDKIRVGASSSLR